MMNLHRINTQNLPSIRVHDHNSMDIASDHHSSARAQRSLPRDIPIPKHSSPTSSRTGSMHGSLVSQGVPPILSLDPPSLPPPHHNIYRHDDTMRVDWSSGDGSEGMRQRRPMINRRDREGTDSHQSSPRGWCPTNASRYNEIPEPLSIGGGVNIKREDSFDKSWTRSEFLRKSEGRGTHPSRLQSEECLRTFIQKSVEAYDNSLVRKLKSDPSSFSQFQPPPRDYHRPFTSGSDDTPLPLPAHWQQPRDHPKSLPTSIPIPIRGPDTPLERWAASGDLVGSRMGIAPEQHPPVFPPSSTDFRNAGDNASISSCLTDNDGPSTGDYRMRRSVSASLLGPGFEDSQNSAHSRSSYDPYGEDNDLQIDDTPASRRMERLTLHEADRTPPKASSYPTAPHHQRAGSKRRASSPPNEDRAMGNSEPTRKGLLLESAGGDIYNRRTPPIGHHGMRNSPGGPSKYHTSAGIHHSPGPRSASGSFTSASASSANTMWSTSIGQFSSASSITTADRASPVTSFSPPSCSDMEIVGDAPFRQVPSSANESRPSNRQRTLSETTITATSRDRDRDCIAVKHHSTPKMSEMGGVPLICECCPKKPKKFDSLADLRQHEMEKQYGCQYCNNRFKNKNEAERHQNSLHLRKHSWSCAALSGYRAAFHVSPQLPVYAEVCGYCGKEFSMPAQWEARIEHLQRDHKFGECNQSKKFYRADHFRQHLKHSHSGTSGKWTNVLENACMRDELAPTSGHGGLNVTANTAISEEGSE